MVRIITSALLLLMAVAGHAGEVTLDLIPQKVLLQYLAGKDNFTLIDARSTAEFEAGHVWGAVNIPHDADLGETVLPDDQDRPLLLYCKSGLRALQLQARLSELGYTEVRVLPPAQMMWSESLPVFNCGATEPGPQTLQLNTVAADPVTSER